MVILESFLLLISQKNFFALYRKSKRMRRTKIKKGDVDKINLFEKEFLFHFSVQEIKSKEVSNVKKKEEEKFKSGEFLVFPR